MMLKSRKSPLLIAGLLIIVVYIAVDALIAPIPPVIEIPVLVVGVGLLIVGRFMGQRDK